MLLASTEPCVPRRLLLTLLLSPCCLPAEQGDPTPGDSPTTPEDTAAPPRAPEPCGGWAYPDMDGDGWGARGRAEPACYAPSGWIAQGGDCDDGRPDRNPGVAERCNGLDDDCDGEVDEGMGGAFQRLFPDMDGDGWGRDDGARWLCGGGDALVARPGDCQDGDPAVHAGAREQCNGRDDDCDGEVDEGCGGSCGDGIKGGAHEACDLDDAQACPGACSAHCACPSAEPGPLRVHMVDVGQGDALLIISPDGFVMLLDAGPGSACDDLDWYLESQGIDAIDYTLVSHEHSDHLGSMDTLLWDHPEVVAAFDNGGWFESSYDQAYFRATAGRRVPVFTGDSIDLGPRLSARVLHSFAGSGNENDNSVVLSLRYGDFDMLLGGDCEYGCEQGLGAGEVDVYKVHHHGASDASSESLLDELRPQVALIPVGEGNSYGHPHSSTISRLEDHGALVLRSDRDGDVVIVSDGETFEVAGLVFRAQPDEE
jgi:beta-lactamase superfamily II metal-dependent hydrolase